MAKTKKPTGLSVSRNNYKFTFEWKIADADHGAGQRLKYYEHYNSKSTDDGSIKINTTQTSTTHTIKKSDYYPNKSDKFLKKISFTIEGQRKKYKKNNKTIDPTWSDPASKDFSIDTPYDPIVTQTLDDDSNYVTHFTWTCNTSTTDHRLFTDYEWETKLTSNGKSPDWSKGTVVRGHANGIDGDTGGSCTGSTTSDGATISWVITREGGTVTITEDSSKVLLGPGSTSYTRHFRVRARGPAGPSSKTKWPQVSHVYAYPKSVQKIYHSQKDLNAAIADIHVGGSLMRRGTQRIVNGKTKSGSAMYEHGENMVTKAMDRLGDLSGAIMTTRKKKASGSVVKLSWDCDVNNGHPIDYCEVEYCIVEPEVSVSGSTKIKSKIVCPANAFPGTIAGRVYDSSGWSAYSFILPNYVPDNQMMFVRVNTHHDRLVNYGTIFEVSNSAGDLSAPTGLSYVNISPETSEIEINTPTNNCPIEHSFIAIFFRSSKKQDSTQIVGIIPWGKDGSGTTILTIPEIDDDDTPGLGMQTFIGNYSPAEPLVSTTDFEVKEVLSSDGIDWSAGVIPMPPTLTVDRVDEDPTQALAQWNWRWDQANAAELSWSSNGKAWQSTTEPSRYIVSGLYQPKWYVDGLSPGTWYFRCRLLKQSGDTTSYGSYSATMDLDLATNPYRPVVQSDTYTVVAGDPFTLYWSFSSEDQSTPDSADITLCPLKDGVPTPNDKPFRNVTAVRGKYDQVVSISTGKERDHAAFSVGSTTYLSVRTRSSTGKVSEWSLPIGITIVQKLTASITSTSLVSKTIYSYSPTSDTSIVSGKTYYVMTENSYTAVSSPVASGLPNYYERTGRTVANTLSTLTPPLSVTVAGNGNAGTSSISITRVENYILTRPELKTDELPYNGFEGETIAVKSRSGAGSISIGVEDLIGTLDDGEKYSIVATLTDSYGQTATSRPLIFEVHWDHQALMPSATVVPDADELITKITPRAPSGVATGDTVDIYRLSADAPELIVKGGKFGTTYVDPYPALGEFGGHRIVFRTSNGDFITENNQLAMVDYTDEDDNTINRFAIVIDFASEQIILPYDISVSNKWSKDFTEVKYLGGSIKGYWNPGVSRSSTISTRVAIQDDENGHDTITAMRRLANYAGICHVRTPDGSSYAANINVNEDREERWVNRIAKFSLDVTKVNPEGFEGMTLTEWEGED